MAPLVSVLIGTVDGREKYLEQTIAAYHDLTPQHVELEVRVSNEGLTLGAAWNRLAADTVSPIVLLGPDDMAPHPGWWQAGVQSLVRRRVPQPLCFRVSGEPVHAVHDTLGQGAQSTWARFFLLWRPWLKRVGPFLDASWFIDLDYSDRLTAAGHPVAVESGFRFTHLDAPRDWLTPEVHQAEEQMYLRTKVTS